MSFHVKNVPTDNKSILISCCCTAFQRFQTHNLPRDGKASRLPVPAHVDLIDRIWECMKTCQSKVQEYSDLQEIGSCSEMGLLEVLEFLSLSRPLSTVRYRECVRRLFFCKIDVIREFIKKSTFYIILLTTARWVAGVVISKEPSWTNLEGLLVGSWNGNCSCLPPVLSVNIMWKYTWIGTICSWRAPPSDVVISSQTQSSDKKKLSGMGGSVKSLGNFLRAGQQKLITNQWDLNVRRSVYNVADPSSRQVSKLLFVSIAGQLDRWAPASSSCKAKSQAV